VPKNNQKLKSLIRS